MGIQMVVFKLLKEEFAIEVTSVESIIKFQSITKIPHAPDFVVGVTNLRGNIVPVINLNKRLELPQTEEDEETRIIVVILKDSKVGMVVDGVTQVVEIEESEIEPTPTLSMSIDSSFIRGIVKIESQLVILLNLEKVFFREE
jgi:purine-binding chemotaxis protein CheW